MILRGPDQDLRLSLKSKKKKLIKKKSISKPITDVFYHCSNKCCCNLQAFLQAPDFAFTEADFFPRQTEERFSF